MEARAPYASDPSNPRGDNSAGADGVRIRTMRPGGPRLADRLPEYPGPARHDQALRGYFDEQGKPVIASAREVAPPSDNPLSWPLRAGAWLAYRTVGGASFWPLNVRSNALLFYLTGKLRHSAVDDLAVLAMWGLVAGVDAWAIWRLLASGGSLSGYLAVCAATFALVPVVAIASSTLAIMRHVARTEAFVPFEELMVTRLSADEVIYGMMIRPFGLLHLVNAAWGLVALPAISMWIVLQTVLDSMDVGAAIAQSVVVAAGMVGLFVVRTVLGMLCINVTCALCMRSRMLAPKFRDALVTAIGKSSRMMLTVLACEGAIVLLAMTAVWYVACLAVPLALVFSAKYLGGMNAKAGALLADTAESWRRWHRLAEDRENAPSPPISPRGETLQWRRARPSG